MRRATFGTLAYAFLAVVCLISSTILLISEDYGQFAALTQLILAMFWAVLAYVSWRTR